MASDNPASRVGRTIKICPKMVKKKKKKGQEKAQWRHCAQHSTKAQESLAALSTSLENNQKFL